MSGIAVRGTGAVSPAGWSAQSLRDTLVSGRDAPVQSLERPGRPAGLRVRRVPPPPSRPAFLAHPRLRRTSPISQFAVHAALEALDQADPRPSPDRLGVVLCVMSGCVNYSRRFYDETLADPATASPLVFPETVFNAPASHLGALLGSRALNYTLVGDPGTFLTGLALGAEWLEDGRIDGCLVVGAEEIDWLTADATRLFSRSQVTSEGAGALYLERSTSPTGPGAASSTSPSAVVLEAITNPVLYRRGHSIREAAQALRRSLPSAGPGDLLFDSRSGNTRTDAPEAAAWADWTGTVVSVKALLGEGFAAASAWQCVAAVEAVRQRAGDRAIVSVVGCNEQAIGAVLTALPTPTA